MTKDSTKPRYFVPQNIKSGDIERTIFRYQLDSSFTKEDLLKSENWRQVVKSTPMLRVGDKIEVLRQDGAFYAELLVTGKSNDDLFTKIIVYKALEEKEAPLLAKAEKEKTFTIAWKGPIKKFALLRDGDNKEIKDGFSSKEEANFYFKNNY